MMEFLHFLSPIVYTAENKIDFLPLIFFLIICGAFIFTIIQVYRKAKPENWEHNWNGGNKNNKSKGLDAEHGSVMDISNAVATSAERIADIMPGMILIIGLLGTFLGLGLALDKASSILTGANAMSNMDASMKDLMGMLQGLGTKFKTSTWGLLAFILLKVILSKNGYEERRLRWSIEKVKNELDILREQKLQEERTNNQKIIDCMQTIAQQFERTVEINQITNQAQLKQLAQHSQDTILSIERSNKEQINFLNLSNEENKQGISSLINTTIKLTDNINNNHINFVDKMQHLITMIDYKNKDMLGVIGQTQDACVQAVNENSTSFKNVIQELIDIIKIHHQENKFLLEDNIQQGRDIRSEIKISGKEQINIVNISNEKNKQAISLMTKAIVESQDACVQAINESSISSKDIIQNLIDTIQLHHQENKFLLEENVQQGRDTRNAMIGFVEKNEATVTTLGESAAGMSTAASTMGNSANHLKGVIDSFRTNMEQVVSLMKKDLNTTISGMNISFGQNMTKMSDNLKTSIGDMSVSFKKNMSEMSQGLGNATQDISKAVNSLSASVDKTMTDVTNTINKSMDLQTKSQSVFVESTDTLNEYINEMTGLVNKLSGDITGGLKAVSESNRHMINLAKKTEELTNIVDGTFKESLQSIESVTTLKPTLENLANSIVIQKEMLQKVANNTMSPNQQKKNNATNKQKRTNPLNTKGWLLGSKGENNER